VCVCVCVCVLLQGLAVIGLGVGSESNCAAEAPIPFMLVSYLMLYMMAAMFFTCCVLPCILVASSLSAVGTEYQIT